MDKKLLVFGVVLVLGMFALTTFLSNEASAGVPALNMPDLIVSDSNVHISYYNASDSNVNVTAWVRNVGNVTAKASTTKISVSPWLLGTHYISTPAIAPSGAVFMSTNYILPNATYILNVTADWFNNVTESNENNNHRGMFFIF